MAVFKHLLPLVAVWGLFLAPAVYAAGNDIGHSYERELNDRDFDALRDFIISKRTINLEEKDCNLTISGDVRSEWRHITEKEGGTKRRGGDARGSDGLPVSKNDFDVEFNLRFDYVCDRAWAVVRVQYDNSAGVDDNGWDCCPLCAETGAPICCNTCPGDANGDGIDDVTGDVVIDGTCGCYDPEGFHGSGTCRGLCLKDAYFGYNICTDGVHRFDIEVGRHSNMYKIFESEVQFLSRFDGILLTYSTSWECVADWYIQIGAFVIDERVNHFGYVGEIGFERLWDTPFTVKYSYIDWVKNGKNRCCRSHPRGFQFRNSQIFVAYDTSDLTCFHSQVFGAFLWNAAANGNHHFPAPRRTHRGHNKQNKAWYVGFELGEVLREGDWSAKVQYQVVEAFSIPDGDVSGIGRGNVLGDSMTRSGLGNTNYQGWRIEGLYAITDNLTINPKIQWSRTKDKNIGGSHNYSEVELEAIYAF